MKIRMTVLLVAIVYAMLCTGQGQEALAATEYLLSKGETVYVPVYSNVYSAPKEVAVHLSNTLTIRNTDIHNSIQVTAADYYDTKGALVKSSIRSQSPCCRWKQLTSTCQSVIRKVASALILSFAGRPPKR